jgi:hypothetical protein
MLVEFQQALADLVANPDFCRRIRINPTQLHERYDLSQREYARRVGMANQRGMECNCMLYRANRLAPLALNLPRFCKAVGPELGPLLSEYSSLFPNTNVHFHSECDRFCRFILRKLDEGYGLDPRAKAALDNEFSMVKVALKASYTVLY